MPGTHLPRWPDDRVARELEAYFAQRAFERWPTYRTFVRDGRRRLYEAAIQSGGPERWAPELGVAIVRHSGGARRSEAEIRADLCALLREHRPERFPTIAWLRKHGPPDLGGAVQRTGGVTRWSRELRVPAPRGIRWSDELIEHELRRICLGRTTWPTREEFAAAGALGLRAAIYARQGSRWWAERLGLETKRLHRRDA